VFYSGEWINDQKSGKGEIYSKNRNLIYRGEFKRDLFHGEGICYDHLTGNMFYKGMFEDNMKHGFGKEYDLEDYCHVISDYIFKLQLININILILYITFFRGVSSL